MSLRHESSLSRIKKYKITLCGPSVRAVLKVYQWTTVVELKQQVRDLLGIPTHQQDLYYKHLELSNNKPLTDYGIFDQEKRHRVLMLSLKNTKGNQHIQTCPGSMCETKLKTVVGEVAQAFAMGLVPVLTDDGTGGTYFLRSPCKDRVAVFKPMDEEPFCPNNPREYVGDLGNNGLRRGVRSGEAAYREVAAYLLDFEEFAQVPPTCLAEALHKNFCHRRSGSLHVKKGSFQSFVSHDGMVEDYSPSMFSRHEVQKIAILDIRLVNLDRNEANILVRREAKQLIPIDHGLTIPDCFEVSRYDVCWMSWPQTKEPLTLKACEYINRLDPVSDIRVLKQYLPFRDKCLRNLRIAGMLLKKGAESGLSLYDIGCILYRTEDDVPSILEKAVANAEQIYSLVKRCSLRPRNYTTSLFAVKSRPRALSANEAELYFGDFLRKFEQSTADSDVTDSPVFLGPIDEEDEDEEGEEGLDDVEDLPKVTQSIHRRTRSTPVTVRPEDDKSKGLEGEEAFDDHLFHYIEAFLDQAVQRKVKETKSNVYLDDRSSECRVRSKSLIQFDF